MSRYLVVTWDGAGNLVSTLGIARRLVERVTTSDCSDTGRSTDASAATAGASAVLARRRVRLDGPDGPGRRDASCARAVVQRVPARDVLAELEREPADVMLVDCMLLGALCAGEAGIPTAALFHAPFSGFRGGRWSTCCRRGSPCERGAVELGLAPVARLPEIHDACAQCIVATPRGSNSSSRSRPRPLRRACPRCTVAHSRIVDRDVDVGRLPLLLVSFSTSFQDSHGGPAAAGRRLGQRRCAWL